MRCLRTAFGTVLALATVAAVAQEPRADAQRVSYCDLVKAPELFQGRLVRVEGVVTSNRHSWWLHDPKCRDAGGTNLELAEKGTVHTKSLVGRLKRDGHAHVVLVGVFYGSDPLAVDPHLPQRLQEKFKGAKKTYGHMGGFDTEIRVTAVEKVSRVAKSRNTVGEL